MFFVNPIRTKTELATHLICKAFDKVDLFLKGYLTGLNLFNIELYLIESPSA